MTLSLNVNGTIFAYPETRETKWGSEASAWAASITTGVLQKSGGSFVLLAEVDFGPSFGLKSLYYKSRTASPATAGQVRLANTDVISFRNATDTANLDLSVNSSNQFLFNGSLVGPSFSDTSTVNLTLTSADVTADVIAGSLTNTHINTAAAIARSKLASGTASRVLINDGTGAFSESSVTSTTLSFLDATSSVQNQINTKLANVEEDTSPSLGGNLNGSTFNITNVGTLQGTTVTGTTGQIGGTISAQSGNFSNSLTISGTPVMLQTVLSRDTSPSLGGNLNGATFNISSVGTMQATTVTGTTGQFGGTVSARTGNFAHSLTISGIPVSVGGAIFNVVEDTTPQLGGDLDVNGKKITAAVGNVLIEALPSSDITLTAGNAGDIYLTTGTVSTINLTAGTAGEINLTTGIGGSIDLASPVVTGTEYRTGGTMRARTGNYAHSLTVSGVAVNIQNTWGSIATNSLSATSSTLSVSSIPNYEYLHVIVEFSLDDAAGTEIVNLTFNGDTGSNYTYERIRVGGGSSGSGSNIKLTSVVQGATAAYAHSFIIVNRASRVKIGTGTSTINVVGGTSSSSETLAFSWNNTSSVISSITLTSETAAVFQAGSRIKIMGMGF